MKHYYDIDGHEFQTPPDPYKGRSPMHKPDGTYNDDAFRAMGGRIVEDGQPTPKEKFFAALNAYLNDLEAEAQRLALDISIDEFKQAAGSMISSELIAWAKSKQVPDEMIDIVRPQILTFIADASRLGMTWSDIFPEVAE
jgi:hypothetical protein